MPELTILERLIDECKKHGLSLSFEYDAGSYIAMGEDGEWEQGQHEPGYRILVGMFGHEGLYPTAHAAQVAGVHCLKQALEFDYDAYADELIAGMKKDA